MVDAPGLHQTLEPTELIPGSVTRVGEIGDALEGYWRDLLEIVRIVDGLAVPGWEGPAADRFQSVFAGSKGQWQGAANAFLGAANALYDYKTAFRGARSTADDAAVLYAAGVRATDSARTKYDRGRDKACREDPFAWLTYPGFSDPGEASRQQARDALDGARAALITSGQTAADALNAVAQLAPEVNGWDQFWSGFGDVAYQVAVFPGSFVEGFILEGWEAVVGTTTLLWDFHPVSMWWTLIVDGDQGLLERYGPYWDGVAGMIEDPWGTAGTILADIFEPELWATNPGQAMGRVTFNIVGISSGVGGAIKSAKVISTAAKTAQLAKAAQLLRAELIDDVIASGEKITPSDVIEIWKTPDGRTVWLEEGKLEPKPSGLAHILEAHGAEFADKGISPEMLPELLKKAINEGEIVGYQRPGDTTRPIYAVDFNGQELKIAITISDNGYIVGANPSSN